MVCQIRILADWAFKKTFPLVISKCPQNDTTQNIASPNVAKCLQRFLVQLDEIAMTCYFHPFSEKYLTIFFFQVAFLSRSNCIHKQQSQFALFHARAYLLLLLVRRQLALVNCRTLVWERFFVDMVFLLGVQVAIPVRSMMWWCQMRKSAVRTSQAHSFNKLQFLGFCSRSSQR